MGDLLGVMAIVVACGLALLWALRDFDKHGGDR
jgi:hypothetical protein